MRNMLSCAEQVQIHKYKTHAYKTPKATGETSKQQTDGRV